MKTPIQYAAALTLLASAAMMAQHTRGGKLVNDATDAACLQLKDANTWSAYTTDMAGVGTQQTLAGLLTDLNTDAVELTSSNHPPMVGYLNGIRWSDSDMASNAWIPQGMTHGQSGSTPFVVATWHWNTDDYAYNNGSRISVVDTTALASSKYRNIILVQPTGVGTYQPVKIHVGGVALVGTYLYIVDTSHGFRVFDLNNIRNVDGDSALCKNSDGSGIFGKVGSNWCADGYGYMLPQVSAYSIPTTKSDGTTIPAACKPHFSWAGNDSRQTTDFVVSGEYCNTSTETCDGGGGDSNGLNGRMYQWPLGSDHKLVTTGGYVNPHKVYFFNESNVQGVAADNVSGATADAYFLSGTYNSGEIYKASPTGTTKTFRYSDSLAPYHPEGMYSTSSSSNHVWVITEGDGSSTNPATHGRVLIYADATALD